MFRKIIKTIIFLPFSLYISLQQNCYGKTKTVIDKVLEEKINKVLISYEDIETLILNNQELRALKELVKSSSLNLSSKISQRYPSLDLQANGFPKYVSGKNYNSNASTTKTSQFSANPSLNLRWDLIEPLRDSEIKIAKDNYKISKNNFEIKKRDLTQEARSRYHKFQKSYKDIENKKFALDLSITSLKNAQSKLEAGIGTKFEVLEADAQLSRDKQGLNDAKIEHKINKVSLAEILNIREDYKIKKDQKINGFWIYKLNKNINEGLANNLTLQNLSIQKSIKENQANSFLNAYKPNIYISNTFSSTFSKGDSLTTLIDPNKSGSNYTNTIGLNFSWNIFDGGKNKKSSKARKAEGKAEDYSYKNFKNILETNISKAYLNLNLNEEKILSSLKEISSTQESLRLSRLRYDVGISTLKDVLIRQKELSDAKSKHVNAIYNYNLNLDELERITFLEINKNCIDNTKSICNIQR